MFCVRIVITFSFEAIIEDLCQFGECFGFVKFTFATCFVQT